MRITIANSVTDSITLKDTLYVPDIRTNLISVAKIVNNNKNNNKVTFEKDRTTIEGINEEEISCQHEGGGFNEEESSQKDVEISPNALEDNESFQRFEVNDDPMLDIGERQAHQGATSTESDMLAGQGPSRPKLMCTERSGHPTKTNQPAANRANQNVALNNDPPYSKETGHSSTASSQETMERNNVQSNREDGSCSLGMTVGRMELVIEWLNSKSSLTLYWTADDKEEELAGSPMVCLQSDNRTWTLVGISNWRIACSKLGTERPRMYDKISSNIEWIHSTTSAVS
uniref:Peptidase S1 domain-containing protein n=1 Tax=Timema monikensis TaxID=170555 RepID=A0A7R9EJ63_9NEOP|nr:unnamed protein product [Timema monikensis]